MTITNNVTMDFQRQNWPGPVTIHAVQGEKYTRSVEISLYSGGLAWNIPEGTTVAVRYGKPDGTNGHYDVLPNGDTAWSVSENVVTIILCPQMLTCPGTVLAQVELINDNELLSTFNLSVKVEADPSSGATTSEDYINGNVDLSGYVKTVNGQAPDENGNVTVDVSSDSGGNAVDTDAIPSYWQSHVDSKVSQIREAMLTVGVNKSAFFFYSDSHWSNDTTYTAKMAPKLLKYLCKNTPINKVNYGGDIVNAEANDSEVMAYLWDWRSQVYGLNHHSVPGNHDDGNTTDNLFSEQYVYGYLLAPEETCDIVRGDEGMYYYIDNPAEKTRYLYLDTAYKGVTDSEQAFVKNALLTTPEGWHIVAIAHLWRTNTYSGNTVTLGDFDTNAKKLLDMFDSFNARSDEFAESSAWVEFCIGGHFHQDAVKHTDGGIPVIIVEADTIHSRNGTVATPGTVTESAISAVIADYNTRTVKVIRVGRGTDYDTTINVKTVKYDNVILSSIDSTEAIFNGGKGWADKSRIGSGKLDSYIGGGNYYITGHIEINPNIDNTFRLRNITFKSDTTVSNVGIAFYNGSFTRIAPLSTSSNNWSLPSAIGNIANGYDPVFDGTNLVQFTLKHGVHIDNADVKYVAFCAEYIGDDSIITINEPID